MTREPTVQSDEQPAARRREILEHLGDHHRRGGWMVVAGSWWM
jgi:hypothetical protein